MSERTLRAAIIGPGKVAHTHALGLSKTPQVELVAVCGRDPRKTGQFASQYHIQPYTDLAEMLDAARIDLLVICTPHPQHGAEAVTALNAGVHVLVEKPMAITLADCDAMLAAAARRKVKLGVISQRRWYEPVRRVRDAIDRGGIGEPALGTVQVLGWRSAEYFEMDPWRGTWAGEGGGVLVNQAVHQLDLFQWLMGPIAELYGFWANLNHPTIEVEDTAVAVVCFQNGALGNIVLSNSQNPGLYSQIHIHGRSGATVGVQTEGGSVFIAGVTKKVEPALNDLWTVPGQADLLKGWQTEDRARAKAIDIMSHYHWLQIQDFVEAVLQDREPLVNGIEGRKGVELFTALYRSQKLHQPISFPLTADR